MASNHDLAHLAERFAIYIVFADLIPYTVPIYRHVDSMFWLLEGPGKELRGNVGQISVGT